MARVHFPPLSFDSTREFHRSDLRALCRGKIVGYVIRHIPTQAMFLGRGSNPDGLFVQWRQRLAGFDKGDHKLSVSFRAIYTMREDFEFEVVQLFDNFGEADDWLNRTEGHIRKQAGREYVLNVTRSLDDRMFWIKRTPPAEHQMRFGGMGNKEHQLVARSRAKAAEKRAIALATRQADAAETKASVLDEILSIRDRVTDKG